MAKSDLAAVLKDHLRCQASSKSTKYTMRIDDESHYVSEEASLYIMCKMHAHTDTYRNDTPTQTSDGKLFCRKN